MKKKIYKKKYHINPVKIHTIRIQLNIASYENRIIENTDIKSAFLNADLIEPYYMEIRSDIAKNLCELDPKYTNYLTQNGSLYVKIKKAIYGLSESGYLWYKKLTNDLINFGYVISEYDVCFMYHPINKTHISIYVDDLLITATDQKYIDDLMKYLTYCYGELNNIKRNNNDEIEYIGLFIKKYKNDKTIKI